MKALNLVAAGSRLKFLLGGALNTGITYAVYLGLLLVFEYQWAFLIAYLIGIALSYFFNALFVFNSQPNWTSARWFPVVYLIQYASSAGALAVLVRSVGLDERIAPLIVTIAMIPLTYWLMHRVFQIASRSNR